MFSVMNHGRGTKNIFDKKGRVIAIKGRSKRDGIDLRDTTVKYFQKLHENGGSLEVQEYAGEEIREQQQVFVKEEMVSSPTVTDAPTVNDLLSRMSTISAQQFRAEAKEILGDKWPAEKVPNREGIVKLLKEHEEGQTQ